MDKKILIVSPEMHEQGGIASVIKTYFDNNLQDGNVTYLSSYKTKNPLGEFVLFWFKFLHNLIVDNGIEIVHIHTSSKGSFLRKSMVMNVAKFFKKKTILHIHGSEFKVFYDKSPKIIKKYIKKTFDKTDCIIVLSKQWKEIISQYTDNTNIQIVYNPIKIQEQNDLEKPIFLFMGRLGKRKGVFDIFEAAKNVCNEAILDLYGDGDIDKSFAPENVNLHGWASGNEKEEIFKNAGVLLLPSYNEGLPISILEAMSHGMPIISTPVGGITEAVKNNDNGFIIDCGDTKALAEKINVLCDKDLRKKMGQESFRIVKEKFDVEIIKQRLKEIYNEL